MLTRIHYYSTGPAEPTFCLCMISWTCFRSELTCKATDTDKFVWVYVCECVWTRTGAASKRCFYEPIKWHCYAIAWGTPQGNKQLKVSALQRRWSGSGITHNFFLKNKRSIIPPLLSSPSEWVNTIISKGPIWFQRLCQMAGYLNE